MDPINVFPDAPITTAGPVSRAFLERGPTTFVEACRHVHQMPYGYNTTRDEPLILFEENRGTCTTKHMAVALLAVELNLPVHKHIGIYAMTASLVTGADRIAEAHGLPYIPVVHCFLADGTNRVDLTEGNLNGKKGPIDTFLFTARVSPDISDRDEYRLYREALQTAVLPREELAGVDLITILKAREEAIAQLKTNMKHQQIETA